MEKEFRKVGTFDVTCGKLMVSDPCYDRGTWCQGVLENVQNGQWQASVLRLGNRETSGWGNRVGELLAERVSESFDRSDGGHWEGERQKFDAGVDSGQMSIVDLVFYPDDPGDYHDEDSFYRKVCNLHGEEGPNRPDSGIIMSVTGAAIGVMSQSGYGDGGYVCYVRRNKGGEITGVRVVFINDEEEDYDD